MKVKSELVGALSLAALNITFPVLADPASDYTNGVLRNLELMCRNLGDEVATNECLTVMIKAKTDLKKRSLEREKDNGSRMEQESLERGYSKFPLTPLVPGK